MTHSTASRRKWRDVLVALYVATQQDLKSGNDRVRAERALQRALEDIERLISPRPHVRYHNPMAKAEGIPCSCAMCNLLREYERHERNMVGSQTSAYGESGSMQEGSGKERQSLAAPSRRKTNSNQVEASIDAIARLEGLIEAAFYRPSLHKLLERHGLAHNVNLERCCVCADQRLRDINTMLLVDAVSLRDVETWTESTGQRISRETLRRHLKHRRTA